MDEPLSIKKKKVRLFLNVLSRELEPSYCLKPRKFYAYNINPNSMYFRVIYSAVRYIESLRGNSINPIEIVIKDYSALIYIKLSKMGIEPLLPNFSPTASNRMEFEHWIRKIEKDNGEKYFISRSCGINIDRIRAKSRRLAAKHKYSKSLIGINLLDIRET